MDTTTTTIAGLNPATATKQEVFDFVAKQLIQQGKPAYEGGCCKYRTADGRKCAAGHLIPDAEYQPQIEGLGVWADAGFGVAALPQTILVLRERLGTKFLEELQSTHDDAARASDSGKMPWLSRWADRMCDLADAHALNSAVLDGVA